MKRIFLCTMALLLGLQCSGCGWMNGSYVSVTPHQVGYIQPDEDLFVVSSYSQLRSALTALVDSGSREALITLADYPRGQALPDLENAVSYITTSYPIGAYAVEDIRYEYGSGGGQEAISLDIIYRRTKTEIDQIRNVRGVSGARDAIAGALNEYQRGLVLQITGYSETDFIQLIEDYSAMHPDTVMEHPQVIAQIYPQQGSVRILELQFAYLTSRESLRYMREQVAPIFSSARLYVSPDASEDVKLSQLYNFLMQRFDYTVQSSITPAYSLLCYGVGDSRAFADVYGAMCRQVGLEAVTVSGTCDGEIRFWNIVRSGDTYYHVDLLRSYLSGRFQLFGDREMSNYVWDYSAYPSCGEAAVELITEPEPTNSK